MFTIIEPKIDLYNLSILQLDQHHIFYPFIGKYKSNYIYSFGVDYYIFYDSALSFLFYYLQLFHGISLFLSSFIYILFLK